MNRRDLVRVAACPIAVAATPALTANTARAAGAGATSAPDHPQSTVKLSNRQFELTLAPGVGLRCRLVHLPTGTLLADGFYSYSTGPATFTHAEKDGTTVVLRGDFGGG